MKMSRINVNGYLRIAFDILIIFVRTGHFIRSICKLDVFSETPSRAQYFYLAIRISEYAAFVIHRDISRDVTGRAIYFSSET